MADRLATLLGTENNILSSEELLMAQDDIWSILKTMDTLMIEFDQRAFKAYSSSGSEDTVAGRACRAARIESPVLSPTRAVRANPAEQGPKLLKPQVVTFHRWWVVLLLR